MTTAQEPDVYSTLATKLAQRSAPKRDATVMDYAALPGRGAVGTAGAALTGLGWPNNPLSESVATDDNPAGDTLGGKVLEGAGAMLPLVIPGAGAAEVATALGASAGVAGAAATATVGGISAAAEGGSAYDRAKAAGADDDQARTAGWLTAPAGLLAIIPAAGWAKSFGRVLGRVEAQTAGSAAASIVRGAIVGGAENAIMATGQRYWEDLIAKEIHSPEEAVSLLEAAKAAPSAAIVGALFGAASRYYAGRPGRSDPEAIQEPVASPEPASVLGEASARTTPQVASVASVEAPALAQPAGVEVMGTPIGRKLEGTTDNTLPPGVKPISKQGVMDTYLGVLRAAGSNSTMLQGGVPEWARGTFHPLTNVIRGTIWGDMATASHEVGHALERAVFGWTGQQSPWEGANAKRSGVTPKAQGELYRLGKALYGNVVPSGGYLREGFAEYIRTHLSDPDALMVKAPDFTRWFDSTFLAQPELAGVSEAMHAAREASTIWRLQGSVNRAAMQTYKPMAPAERAGRAMQWMRYLTSAQAWTRAEAAMVKFEGAFEKQLGRKLMPDERVVEAADAVRRQAAGTAKMLMESHTGLDDGVTVTGESLMQAIAPAKGDYEAWHQYAWAKRALAMLDMREAVLDPLTGQPIAGVSRAMPKDPGMSVEDATYIVEQTERDKPHVAKAVNSYYAWNDRVNDTIASIDPEMGALFKNLDAEQKALNPGWEANYVPLRRKVDDLESVTPGRRSTGGAARRGQFVKSQTGSGRPVKDILPEIMAQAQQRLEMAYSRVPLLRMLELADAHPQWAQPFIRPAGEEMASQAATALADARKSLLDQGALPNEAHDMVGSALSLLIKPKAQPGGRDPVLPVYRRGRLEMWEVDRDVYKGLTNFNAQKFTSLWHTLLTVPKNALVQGSTVLRPAFGFILNPMVDLPTFVLNTRHYSNPAVALAQWTKYLAYSLVDGMSNGKLHEIIKDPNYDVFKKLGMEYGQSYYVNSARTDVSAKRIMQRTARKVVSIGRIIDYAAQVMSSTEKAGRVAEMAGALKDIGWDGKRPLTAVDVQQARVAAKQVTIDFTQAGEIAATLNKVIPFFNSPIQGGVAFYRAAKDHPIRFAAGAVSLLGLGLANWNQNKDEEWYHEMPLDERTRYWHVRVKVNGRDELVRIKKPQEFAAVGSIIEELADAVYHKRAPQLGAVGIEAAEVALPPLQLPTVVNEPVQLLTNHDFYTGGQIVPDSQKNLPAAEQKGEFTSWAADRIGKATSTSPRMVDHFMRAFAGGLPRDLMDLTGMGASLNGRETSASDQVILGAAFRRGGLLTHQSVSLQNFYRLMDLADGRSKSKEHPETGDEAHIRGMLEDAGSAIASMNYVRDTYLKTNKERDAMMQDIVSVARRAADCAAAGKWDPVTFEAERRIQSMKRDARDIGGGTIPRHMRTN